MAVSGEPWQGIFQHKNSFGTVAAFGVVFFAVVGSRRSRVGWVVFGLACLELSQSKGALVAAIVALTVMGVAHLVYMVGADRQRVPAAIFYAVLIAGGYVVVMVSRTLLQLLDRRDDFTGRTEIWRVVVDYGSSHHLTGTGIGAQIYDGSELATRIFRATGQPLGTTHNGFLVVYLGLGVVGVILLAIVFVYVLGLIERERRRGIVSNDRILLSLGLVACYVVMNLSEDRLVNRTGWFFLLFALLQLVDGRLRPDRAPAAMRIVDRSSPERTSPGVPEESFDSAPHGLHGNAFRGESPG
jgi:O-antigen ligase